MVAEERRPSNRKNRRARRAKPKDLPWTGRCFCEHCNGRAWPHIYVYPAKVGRRKYGQKDRRPRTTVSYECFIESQVRPEKPLRISSASDGQTAIECRTGTDDTTDSASAAGIRWLADLHAFGVNVTIGEAELPPGGGYDPDDPTAGNDDLELEVVRHASFLKYVARAHPDDEDAQRMREKRYWDLCGEFTGRRLHQWFYVEFPGWLTQQYHAKVRK